MRRGRTATILLLMTALFAGLALALYKEPKPTFPLLNQPLPPIQAPILSGKVPTQDMFLVNFFASWCLPCLAEHPYLSELAKDIPIIGIAYQDEQAKIAGWLNKHGNPFQMVVLDENGADAVGFGISGVPETFVVKNGRLRYRFKGPLVSVAQTKAILREVAND